MSDNKTIALVSGASSGMGLEFCRQLAARCDVIIAVARRIERLQALTAELSGACEVHPVQADLASVEGVAHTMEMLRQKGPVNILVNNAGFTAYGEFSAAPIEQQRSMLKLHCDATITLCRAAIPFMQELGGGSIINVSSLGSFMPGPGLAVYGASKAFLNSFSLGLQAELAGTGIQVQVLCPGMVRTEIFEPMKEQGFDTAAFGQEMWMESADVVAASLTALGGEELFVIPGEGNLDLARQGIQGLLDSLG
jgi:uncharacterized protein